MRLDGGEMAADADDGDAGHSSGSYMSVTLPVRSLAHHADTQTRRYAGT